MKPLYYIFLMMISAAMIVACSKDDDDMEPGVDDLLDKVRAQTAAFVDFDAAIAAGWDTQLSECIAHPTEGGMGMHFGRMEFFDGRVNHLEPQVLLYLPDGNGGMEFLGVEYIVPFAILPDTADAPILFGHNFHQNNQQEFWALHVWTERDNPSGTFSDWNPTVNCD